MQQVFIHLLHSREYFSHGGQAKLAFSVRIEIPTVRYSQDECIVVAINQILHLSRLSCALSIAIMG
mgnify:FL=1